MMQYQEPKMVGARLPNGRLYRMFSLRALVILKRQMIKGQAAPIHDSSAS